jgi:BMFP domain-containing protein YqiC
MQVKNPLLDDIARLASGALGAASGVKGEVEVLVRERLHRLLDGMELVGREEFEAVKAMAAKAREEQDILAARLDALEGKANPAAKNSVKKAAKKAASKAAPAKPQAAAKGAMPKAKPRRAKPKR